MPHHMGISDTGEKHCRTNYCTHCDKPYVELNVLALKQKVDRGECPGPILWEEVNAERQHNPPNTPNLSLIHI